MELWIEENGNGTRAAITRVPEEQVIGDVDVVGAHGTTDRVSGGPWRRAATARSGNRAVVDENIVDDSGVIHLDRATEGISARTALATGGTARAALRHVGVEGVIDNDRREAGNGPSMPTSRCAASSGHAITAPRCVGTEDIVFDCRQAAADRDGSAVPFSRGGGCDAAETSRLIAGKDIPADLDLVNAAYQYCAASSIGAVRWPHVEAPVIVNP